LSRRHRSLGLRPIVRALGCLIVAASLVGCSSFGGRGGFGLGGRAASGGETFGTGSVRVAMLLPRSARGNGGETARAFRNAAELAMRDFPSADIQVTVYDTKGTQAGAQAALGMALAQGSEIVFGPLFSAEVAAVAPQARAAGVPIVAFSSDASVAGPGVYLLSFLPADDVRRIVSYSASQGRKSFAALLPANAYGTVVEAAFRRDVAAVGGRVVTVKSYQATNDDIQAKAAEIASVASRIDALLMPDAGDVAPALAAALAARGVTRDKVRLLGSGQWDDARILNDTAMVGGWYPAPIKQGFEDFARRYRAAAGAPPPRNATLAYDATVLAAGLVRQYAAQRFQPAALASPNGFAGVDGLFRFLPGGLTERRYAVYEVTGSGARVISPAATTFAVGG
jgi:ABC-type branched-subunit amino acid transport system substrate-binding protein